MSLQVLLHKEMSNMDKKLKLSGCRNYFLNLTNTC